MAMAPIATAAMIATVTSWERCCIESVSLGRATKAGSGGAPAMVPDRLPRFAEATSDDAEW